MRGTHTRRRRGVATTVIVALLVAGVLVVSVGVLRMRGPGEATAAPAAADPGRRPWQVTLDVDQTAGYVVTAGVTDGARQTLTVQSLGLGDDPDGTYGGEVTAFPPGTLDERQFSTAEQVNDSWYLAGFTFAGHATGDAEPWQGPAVGRRDPSGIWIVVYADTDRADGKIGRPDLFRLAAAARLGPPRDLRLPLRLGRTLPKGLELTYVRSPDQRIDRRQAAVGFSAPARRPSAAAVYTGLPPELDVAVLTGARDAAWTRTRGTLTGQTRIAGLPAWYEPGTRLIVEAERCVVTVRSALPRADLTGLVENLTIGDCADPDSWIPPLS
ncbi:hypothetical protein [Actinoplanes sp. NPDC049599]|uniref:hypothetical protein n=1 Tax=Actinoplanes sp. NPDC049599 TaxID=3363903 RepID=UPI00379F4740